jgi:predicted DNA-binding protein (MmcQ/YjbR family)
MAKLPAKRDAVLDKRRAAVKVLLEAQPGAVISPRSPRGALIYHVMGKMFAILSTGKADSLILKSDPHLVALLRDRYAGIGHRSHLDRRFWISVSLDADVPVREVKKMIAQSHDLVCAGLTRKQKDELKALSS